LNMEFDFLKKLPNSDLDDRRFKDLVEECILRIPRYTPEWTNHNPGDPGITLIELFAWLTDQMGMRFNQVPRRNYIAFLELLGIRLAPPEPARTDVTFYLSSPQPSAITIPIDTEVATERTASTEAIVFSIDRPLIVGKPHIKHFLTAITDNEFGELKNSFPQSTNNLSYDWTRLPQAALLFSRSSINNCFYLVLDAEPVDGEQSLNGNVVELSIRGEAATGTGINPDAPPRLWQAWDGHQWQSILRQELDDNTVGFNFSRQSGASDTSTRQASITLHLPTEFPIHTIGSGNAQYEGHIIRCIYRLSQPDQAGYDVSPRIMGLEIKSVGGTVPVSQGIWISRELLGISDGKPGQRFQLQMRPVLQRQAEEHIQIISSSQEIQDWKEVGHFGNSRAYDRHYLIDDETGEIQFGPLIRGPRSLKKQTIARLRIQAPIQQRSALSPLPEITERDADYHERQYGAVPPIGSEIVMTSYRFGGSKEGNVQAEKIVVLRSSLPYVSRVINYQAATGGSDGESIEEAVMRVPHLIRSRESAITPEDFETMIVVRLGGRVARAYCIREEEYTSPGVVRLIVTPRVEGVDWRKGINPDESFQVTDELRRDIADFFRDRKPLGIKVQPEQPEYVGVSVNVQIYPEITADRSILAGKLKSALYRFLNPLTGGTEQTGWPLGRPVHMSDITAICQQVPGVRHVGLIQMMEARKQEGYWVLSLVNDGNIVPGALGYICSWAAEGNVNQFFPTPPLNRNDNPVPGHTITFID
jgi:predicted phage baseplate assembly protein